MRTIILSHGATLRVTITAWILCLAAVAHGGGHSYMNAVRPQDEIVVVNVRSLGGSCDAARLAQRVQVETYQVTDESRSRCWQRSDMASLTAADPTVSTIIFVHGNRLSQWDAKQEGLAVYRRVVRQTPDEAPIRFVIFSWPSSDIGGLLKDVRVKAARTRPAGCQLAWVVDQLPPETPLTMVGFSFGARIITGSLHVLGGGSLGGMSFGELQQTNRRPVQAVLLASALNADWLCPGRCHGQAMTMVEHMVLVNNCADRAMKFYHLSSTSGRPRALGLTGPTCIDAEGASKIVNRNVSGYVGKEHDLFRYLSAPGVTMKIARFASPTTAGFAVAAN